MNRSGTLLCLGRHKLACGQLKPFVSCGNIASFPYADCTAEKPHGNSIQSSRRLTVNCRHTSDLHQLQRYEARSLNGNRRNAWSHFGNDGNLLDPRYYITSPLVLGVQRRHARSGNKTKLDARREKEDEEEAEEDVNASDTVEDDAESPHEWRDAKLAVTSPRYDTILKMALNCNRTKVEEAFMDNRVRVNGVKIMKKSETAALGDEIDMIIGLNTANPDFLDVSRVIVDSVGDAKAKSKLTVNVRVWKRITTTNYAGANRHSMGGA